MCLLYVVRCSLCVVCWLLVVGLLLDSLRSLRVCCSLIVARCWLFVACCALFVARCVLFVGCWLVSVVRSVVRCLPFSVSRVLFDGCCLLRVVWRL